VDVQTDVASASPSFGWLCEAGRELRSIDGRRRRRFCLELIGVAVVFWQALELIQKHHRLMRRHLELFAARLARHFVVETKQVIAQFLELGAIFSLRLSILSLGAPHPAKAVFVDALTPRTRKLRRAVFWFLLEIRFLVKGHEGILLVQTIVQAGVQAIVRVGIQTHLINGIRHAHARLNAHHT
jgi:hypothetical protein